MGSVQNHQIHGKRGSFVRAFTSIEIPCNLRREIEGLLAPGKSTFKGVKWVATENLHITLKFLGNVEEDIVGTVSSRLARVATEMRPFSLSLGSVGAFPSLYRPRVLWIGVKKGEDVVRGLHDKIDRALSEIGFDLEERSYHPHVTVGRVRGGARLRMDQLFSAIHLNREFPVLKFNLMKSTLLGKGPVYDIIEELVFSES